MICKENKPKMYFSKSTYFNISGKHTVLKQ